MKNSQRAVLALEVMLVLAIFCATFAFADGAIIPIYPDQPYPLVLNHHVNITINGEHAVVVVDQEFQNNCSGEDGGVVPMEGEIYPRPPPTYYCRDIQGTYVFPVPDGGVKDFSLEVGGKVLEGQMLDAQTAAKIYQENAIARKDASLLSYVGKDTFAASVSIPKGETVRVRITYEQELKSSNGLNELFYPLSTERYTTQPIDPVDLRVNISANGKIGFIYSPTYNVTIDRDVGGNASSAHVTYYSKEIPDRDFILYYGTTEQDYDVKLVDQKKSGADEGYFMMFLYPEVAGAQVVPKDVVFVIDTSGSMSGTKIEQAKSALKYSLEKLNPDDKFGIVTFNNLVDYYNAELQGMDEKDAAISYVSALDAGGSTNIYDALRQADGMLANESDGRLHVIVLLTDGEDTTGHSNEMILGALNNSDAKLFPFGVGEEIDFELLDKLANEYGDGIPTYIKSDDQLETVMENFVDRISRPLLTDVTVDIQAAPYLDSAPGFDGQTSDVLPTKIPSIFSGSQIVLVGKYNGSGMAPVVLNGKVAGQNVSKTYMVTFDEQANNPFVERAWATRKVGYLLDQITIDGETPELKAEITELATKYGIPTPYTSYVVTDANGGNYTRTLDISQAAPEVSYGGAATAGAAYKSAGNQGAAQNYAESGTEIVEDKTFISTDGTWSDTSCGAGSPTRTVVFGSDEYLKLSADPEVAKYLSAGESIVLCTGSEKIAITANGAAISSEPLNISITTGASGIPQVQVTGATPEAAEKNPLGWLGQLVPIGIVLVFITGFVLYQIMLRRPQMVVELETHKALASDTRYGILHELVEGDRTPTDLSSKLGKSKSTVVEHLDKMIDAGLIEKLERPGKKFVFYRITRKGKDSLHGTNGSGFGS